MPSEKRTFKKTPDHVRREDTPGERIDSGPYIGIVKNNIDPTRNGRLQVWIPELCDNPDLVSGWRTVNYASPFIGQTTIDKTDGNKLNDFDKVPHTYGFWMVPPDINVEVLVMFVAGDPRRGYWFACTVPDASHSMIPAIGASTSIDRTVTKPEPTAKEEPSVNGYPVAEFYPVDTDSLDFYNTKKPIHTNQYNILLKQGLQEDPLRGVHSSSSQRESPSNVFGFSSPGREAKNTPAPNPDGDNQVDIPVLTYATRTREGGHVLVMDDGDYVGANQLFKLRSARGHQILMNDSDNLIYITNAEGTAWVELTGDGQINLFSDSGFNFRTRGTMNLHADLDININAGKKLNMFAGQAAQIDATGINLNSSANFLAKGNKVGITASGGLNLSAGGMGTFGASGALIFSGSCINLNSVPAPPAEKPTAITKNTLADATQASNGVWSAVPGKLTSIVAIAPTHEPFERKTGKTTNLNVPADSSTPSNPDVTTEGDLLDIIVAFLKKEEGLPKGGKAYLDPPGNTDGRYAIGYGHSITETGSIQCGDEAVPIANPKSETKMTPAQAEKLLKVDLTKSGGYISKAQGAFGPAWDALNKYQKAACVSYVYNVGNMTSLSGPMTTLINRDQLADAGQLIATKGVATINRGQPFAPLKRRRAAETALWNTA